MRTRHGVGQDKVLLQPTCKRLRVCDDLRNTAVKRCSAFTSPRVLHPVSFARVATDVGSPHLGDVFSATGGTPHEAGPSVGDVPTRSALVVRGASRRAGYR